MTASRVVKKIQKTISQVLIVMMLGQVIYIPSIWAEENIKLSETADRYQARVAQIDTDNAQPPIEDEDISNAVIPPIIDDPNEGRSGGGGFSSASITASSAGGGASSSSGSSGSSSSEIAIPDGNIPETQMADISLSTGTMSLARQDLRLPGKNGMDVVINRTYASSAYNSKAGPNPKKLHVLYPARAVPIADDTNSTLGGEGAGMTMYDINNNGIKDMVIFSIRDVDGGANEAIVKIGYDLKTDGTITRWGNDIILPFKLWGDMRGGGIAVGDFDGNGRPDYALMFANTGDQMFTQFGWDINTAGRVTGGWSDKSHISGAELPTPLGLPGQFGDRTPVRHNVEAIAIGSYDFDNDGKDDIVLGYTGRPNGGEGLASNSSQIYYKVGSRITRQGNNVDPGIRYSNWRKAYRTTSPRSTNGLALEIHDLNNNNRPELIFSYVRDMPWNEHVDDPDIIENAIGWDVASNGTTRDWETKSTTIKWQGEGRSQHTSSLGSAIIDFNNDGEFEQLLLNTEEHTTRYHTAHLDTSRSVQSTGLPSKIGNGWRLNVGMRGYIAKRYIDDRKVYRVYIDQGNGIETFTDPNEDGVYTSLRPGDMRKIRFTPNSETEGLTLITDQGITYRLGTQFYTETMPRNGGIHRIWGFELTNVKDLYNNTVSYTYTNLDTQKTIGPKGITNLNIEEGYTWWFEDVLPVDIYSNWGEYQAKRLTKITDTYGRDILFSYDTPAGKSNTDIAWHQKVKNIRYTNVNGTTNTLTYDYDAHGNLLNTHINNEPSETYDYTRYTPQVRQIWRSAGSHEILVNDFLSSNIPYGTRRVQTKAIDSSKGYQLKSITSPLGAEVEYFYEESVQYGRRVDGTPIYNIPDRFLDAGSYPVIIKKEIRPQDSAPYTYTFTYPRDNNGKLRNTRWAYSPIWKEGPDRLYNYRRVSVTNSLTNSTETVNFIQGKETSRHVGTKSVVNSWDFDKNRLLEKSAFEGSVLQTKEVYRYVPGETNNLYRITYFKGNDYIGDITYHYDSRASVLNKNMVRLRTHTIKDFDEGANKVQRTKNTYNTYGKVIKSEYYNPVTASYSTMSTQTYDSQGRGITSTMFKGTSPQTRTTTSYRDGNFRTPHRLTSSTQDAVTGSTLYTSSATIDFHTGRLLSKTGINGEITTATYDDLGRVIQNTLPDGTRKTISYSRDYTSTTSTYGNRSVTTIRDAMGRPTIIDNPVGKQDSKITYFIGGAKKEVYTGTHPGQWTLKKSYTYDSYMRPTSVTDTRFGVTRTSYNDRTHTTTTTDPKGRQSIVVKNALGHVLSSTTQTVRDSRTFRYLTNNYGEVTQTTDAEGKVERQVFDFKGQLQKIYRRYNSAAYSQPPASVTIARQFYNVYDPAGNVITRYTYTRRGLVDHTFTYTYDRQNRLITMARDGDVEETYTYDQNISTTSGQTSYNLGALTSVENDTTKTTYSYDIMGRLQEQKKRMKSQSNLPIRAASHMLVTQTTYTAMGDVATYLVKTETDIILYSIRYTYDSLNRVSSMAYEDREIAETPVISYTYDSKGRVQTKRYGNNIAITHTYDKDVLLTELDVQKPNPARRLNLFPAAEALAQADTATLYNQTYTYDAQGQVTGTRHTDVFNPLKTHTRTYGYSQFDELTSVAVNGTSNYYTYSYDKSSNRTHFGNPIDGYTQANGANTLLMNPKNDELVEYKQSRGKFALTYDPEGNLKTETAINPDGVEIQRVTYDYNYQGHPTRRVHRDLDQSTQENNPSTFAHYAYDTDRLRIHRQERTTAPSAETHTYNATTYVWDDGGRNIIESPLNPLTGLPTFYRTPSQNNTLNLPQDTRYIYEGNEKIAMVKVNPKTQTRELFWFVNNLQGTTMYITDSEARVVQSNQVDEYGTPERAFGMFVDEIHFTGKKYNMETGQYYFNQRYYSPLLGRFITKDPAMQGFNPYVYAGNNPNMYVDPDGEFFGLIIGAMLISAAINTTIQLAQNDWDFSSLNWQSIATSALQGGMTAGIGIGLGVLAKTVGLSGISTGMSLLDDAFNTGMSFGTGSVISGLVTGQSMDWDNVGEMFGSGFLMGAAVGGGSNLLGRLGKSNKYNTSQSNLEIAGPPNEGVYQDSFGDVGIDSRIKVAKAGDSISDFLGPKPRIITNAAGDKVFLSTDGLRRVRFDINRTFPHQNIHSHVEEIRHGVWRNSGQIYPIGVPKR